MDATREPTHQLRRRQFLGWGSLLLGVPFAASAVAVFVSCHVDALLQDFALYVAPVVVFVLGSFGLYQVNAFGFIRSPLGRVVAGAVLVAALEAVWARGLLGRLLPMLHLLSPRRPTWGSPGSPS